MLTAVLLAPLAVLLSQVLGRDGLAIVPVATVIGVLAAVVQFLGLDEGSSYFRAKLGTRKGQRAMVASAAHGLLAGRHCALPRPVCRSRPRLPTLREAQVARSSIRRGTTGRRTIGQTLPGRSSWVPAFLPAPRGRGHGGPDQRLPGLWSWSEAAGLRWGRHSLGWL
jgi:hypothetical protein